MQTTEQAAKRPFHETIVDAITTINSYDELNLMARLIKATKIPKGHDEITTAWNQRMKEMGLSSYQDRGVPASLLEQKQASAVETPLPLPEEASTETDEEKDACIHVGSDGRCTECTKDETSECGGCEMIIIAAKGHACRDEECNAIFCDNCEGALSEYGFCEDHCTFTCDCDAEIERGEERRCAAPDCDIAFCDNCATNRFTAEERCASHGGENETACVDCGDVFLVSRLIKCAGSRCGNAFCARCKPKRLNLLGRCSKKC